MHELFTAFENDATHFYDKGNKAARIRLRNAMQELKTLAQEIRNEVTEKKNAK
ncbi:MAG: histone H1 [Pyrinomonadaceae bacterium]|nr:histone H1 [Sphingobacteriaceae bacterium]